ncbi:MAG: D-aminoacylase [Pseudomonadota bacterium]
MNFDLVIGGAKVIDGSGRAAFQADVGVTGDRIAEVGNLGTKQSSRALDGAGLVLAPGFIDVHTHDDRAVLATPHMTPKVSQGVTSVVVGNCGISLSPIAMTSNPPPPLNLIGDQSDYRFSSFSDYARAFHEAAPAVNVAALIGHSSLRAGAMDQLDRPASEKEINKMAADLDAALAGGAIGLSSGLDYPPAKEAEEQEVARLCAPLAQRGGIYTTHMRDEGDEIMAALEETFRVGRTAQVPIVISHKKCAGHRNWGRSKETLQAIALARQDLTIELDCYPYIASSTVLLAKYLDRTEEVLITWSDPYPECAGRHLSQIAAEWGCSIFTAAERLAPAGAIYFQMDEGDLQRIMTFDGTMIGSDGLPHDKQPHPRLWGTFPRVLGHYCRDLGLLELEQAVHRMTGKPASVFGLEGRGEIRPGAYADLILFDPDKIIDKATFAEPCQAADGIEAVLVNGQIVWQDKCHSGAGPGQLLRRKAR